MTASYKVLFSWRAFLVGVVVSSVSVSLLGWEATGTNNFVDFVRFYRDISPEALYYPTARQVESLVESRYDPTKVLVIVGGSSVFRGTGQNNAGLWTRVLQKNLGDKFVVLNLAMNGGAAVGLASYMSEYMTKTGKKFIYLTDTLPDSWQPQGPQEYYQYFYYEALARGLLIDSPQRNEYTRKNTTEFQQSLSLRAYGNELFNYEELWQFIGYKYIFTTYTSLMFMTPWIARELTIDDEVADPNRHFQDQSAGALEQEMKHVEGFALFHLNPEIEKAGLSIAFPDPIRPKMILVGTGQAPFYLDRLTPEKRNAVLSIYDGWMDIIQQSGMVSAPAYRVLSDDDHWDRVHLNERGGIKLANFVAPFVRRKARDLGYVD